MLDGISNTAGEIGHMIIDLNGSPCTCGSKGCLETLAGGWGIAKRAKEHAAHHPEKAKKLLKEVNNNLDTLTTKIISQAAKEGDAFATDIMDHAISALIAGTVSLVNAFNPEHIIFGGGVVEGMPQIIQDVEKGIRLKALQAATQQLQILPAKLHNEAGAIGAGALALRTFSR